MVPHLLDLETVILTPRTVFRRFREGEGAALYELLQNNYNRLSEHFFAISQSIHKVSDAEYWARTKLAHWLTHKEFFYAIWDKTSAKLIGFIGLEKINWDIPKAKIVFLMDKDFSQKGIMTEVLTQLVAFAFEEMRMEKLAIITGMDNYPAQRLARKCGFMREGDLRSEFRKPTGEMFDIMLFGLSLNAYEKYTRPTQGT